MGKEGKREGVDWLSVVSIGHLKLDMPLIFIRRVWCYPPKGLKPLLKCIKTCFQICSGLSKPAWLVYAGPRQKTFWKSWLVHSDSKRGDPYMFFDQLYERNAMVQSFFHLRKVKNRPCQSRLGQPPKNCFSSGQGSKWDDPNMLSDRLDDRNMMTDDRVHYTLWTILGVMKCKRVSLCGPSLMIQ
jgi:hypothetical protein